MENQERIKRWRLILGRDIENKLSQISPNGSGLSAKDLLMDQALGAVYDNTQSEGQKGAGLGPSYPNIAKWLADLRSCFPQSVVNIVQSDAIERKGLSQLILEPESLSQIVPDVNMVSLLLTLKGLIPKKSKEQARALVKSLVDQLVAKMESDLRRAVRGALNKREHTPIPSFPDTDWKKTIFKNLKNYDQERKQLIAEKFYFYQRQKRSRDWQIILDLDQSGSMSSSIIYASIMASIFASIPALETRVVAFDTQVTDLSEACANDPVDLLFGIQLGGGTDINRSLQYCSQLIHTPQKTLFILISDLYEGGVQAGLLRQLEQMKEAGVTVLVLLALSDQGTPSYDEALAQKIANLNIACFGVTPDKLPDLVAAALRKDDLVAFGKNL